TDVLAENAVGLASRGRLARTRAAVKKHPDYSEHGYFLAVELAFKQWEAMQNVGLPQKSSDHVKWCLVRSIGSNWRWALEALKGRRNSHESGS
ncbi:MAG: hypothetical protein WA704_21420, partial [Pseudolabrys sp.]